MSYAVVDFETTGLFPQKRDRVVEMAFVHLDARGRVESEWSTLVNPERDVGPTHIHGILARDVLGAPTFADLSTHVMHALQGRTVVAHNAAFDLRFLDDELNRAGWPHPRPFSSVCTMQWSQTFVRSSSRKLVDCCDAAGITHLGAHEARHDAMAVARLFGTYLHASHPELLWAAAVTASAELVWPDFGGNPDPEVLCRQGHGAPRRPGAWLDRIVARLPRRPDLIEGYLDVLEAALLDGYLSAHEEEALVELACELGLSREDLGDVHRAYLGDLAAAAVADGVVTAEERSQLEAVAELLGMGASAVEVALEQAPEVPATGRGVSLAPGDCICLTGQMSLPREDLIAMAESRGLVVGGLSRRSKLLVAADPDTLSGKAQKARGYGIPIVDERALLSYLLMM